MKQFLVQHKKRILLTGILLVFFATVGFNLFFNELRKRSKAAPAGTPILYFEPTNPPMSADQKMSITLKLDPNGLNSQLYSFDIQIKFDETKLEFFNAGDIDGNLTLAQDILSQQKVLDGTNLIHIVGTKTTNAFAPDNQNIGVITFKMKAGKDFPLEFDWGDVTIQTTNFVKVPLVLTSNAIPTSSSSSSSSSNANEILLSFSSNQNQYHVGDTVNLDITSTVGTKKVGGVGATFVFDPTLLIYKNTIIDSNFTQNPVIIPPASGSSTISVSVARSTAITGTFKIATVSFMAKAMGTVNFAFTKDQSSIYTLEENPQNILTSTGLYSVAIIPVPTIAPIIPGVPLINAPPGEVEDSQGDLLHINSNASYQSPFRYEQTVTLQSSTYVLSGLAKVYTSRGRGVQIIVFCGETDCNNGKHLNDVIAKSPYFIPMPEFRRQEVSFTIVNGPKKYLVRVFADEGSEVDFDYISLKNEWDGELIENPHFSKHSKKTYIRKYPLSWDFDQFGLMYGGLYKQTDGVGKEGVLFINSSSR